MNRLGKEDEEGKKQTPKTIPGSSASPELSASRSRSSRAITKPNVTRRQLQFNIVVGKVLNKPSSKLSSSSFYGCKQKTHLRTTKYELSKRADSHPKPPTHLHHRPLQRKSNQNQMKRPCVHTSSKTDIHCNNSYQNSRKQSYLEASQSQRKKQQQQQQQQHQ
jgi:hypothetical protein